MLFLAMTSSAQDISIVAKDHGTEVELIATNNENKDVTVTIELDAKGYDIGPSNKVEVTIPKKETIEVGRYKRDQSKTASFKYGYSLTKTTTSKSKKSSSSSSSSTSKTKMTVMSEVLNAKPEDGSLKNAKGLYVYSINGCGRCSYTTKFLKSNNIKFVEKNMDEDKESKNVATGYLYATGFEGGSFQTPVIVHDGKVSYNIKDLKGFLKGLK